MKLAHLVAVAAACTGLSLNAAGYQTQLLVPAYFYPSFDPAQSFWDELTASAATGVPITVIMNPDNGPGAAFNSDYASAVDAFRAAGGRVLGYAYTCYGRDLCVSGLPPTRSTADVLADAQRYADWYTVDGIFLDEVSNRLEDLGFYTDLANAMRSLYPGWQIVGNPGAAVPAAYLDVTDTLVTFERGTGSYDGWSPEPWMTGSEPARQAHLHYNVSGEGQMRDLLSQARSRGAGYVYITDDEYVPGDPTRSNPWDRLPSYWQAEVAAVSTVDEPAPLYLLLVGAIGLVFRRARSGAVREPLEC